MSKISKAFNTILIIWFLFNMFEKADANTLAFHGAEGGGRFSTGGRGGKVVYVTNLNDSGPGSLREACETKGARFIVFNVSGIIKINEKITIDQPYITIAGQSAPDGGITIKGNEIRINTHDVIIQYLKVRTGKNEKFSYQEGDSIAISGACYNIIVDHCSLSWSNDENLQIWSGKKAAHSITISNSIISEGLRYNHPSCGLIVGSDYNAEEIKNISIIKNFFSNCQNRMPLIKGKEVQIINNIIYNWEWTATSISGGVIADIIGNIYKKGPVKNRGTSKEIVLLPFKGIPDTGPKGMAKIFLKDNIGEQNLKSIDDQCILVEAKGYDPCNDFFNESHFSKSQLSFNNGEIIKIIGIDHVEQEILKNSGASKRIDQFGNLLNNRDLVDERLIYEYKSLKGKIPFDESDVGGYPIFKKSFPNLDSDLDGISDFWEIESGLNPYDSSDSVKDKNKNGYSDIEDYLSGNFPVSSKTPERLKVITTK